VALVGGVSVVGGRGSPLGIAAGVLTLRQGRGRLIQDEDAAAPENHKVLYEDDKIRVISVGIAPGKVEKPHRYPSVFVIDRMVQVRDFNGVSNEEIPLPLPDDVEFPIAVKFLPQPLHYVENTDTNHFTPRESSSRKAFRQAGVLRPEGAHKPRWSLV
jgi:hypothetical protein